jgi:hypothetical protein
MASTKTDPALLTLGRILRYTPALADPERRYLISRLESEMGRPAVVAEEEEPEQEPLALAPGTR